MSSGSKRSFCLEDTDCQPGITPNYTCNYQGITAGCGDLYGANLGCQYVDVTNVPNGSYQLRVKVDPYQRIAESDETNNVTTTTVTINRPNQCTGAIVLPAEGGTFSGTTSGASALTGCVTATNGAPEKVYSWTAPRSGTARAETCGTATTFDTVLYVRSGSCRRLAGGLQRRHGRLRRQRRQQPARPPRLAHQLLGDRGPDLLPRGRRLQRLDRPQQRRLPAEGHASLRPRAASGAQRR